MSKQDAYVAGLVERLKRVIPYRGVAKTARDMGISVSHLHRILAGKSDAGSVYRAQIATFLARHEKSVPQQTKVLDSAAGVNDSMPRSVMPAPDTPGRRIIEVPSPVHVALCEMLSMLPAAVIMQWFPPVEAEVKRLLDDRPTPPTPDPTDNNAE